MHAALNNTLGNALTIDAARALANQYACAVADHLGQRLISATLFGSAARGDWSHDSDIDVCLIISEMTPSDTDWIIATAYRMGLGERDVILQPVFFDEIKFKEMIDRERSFAQTVQHEGINLLNSSSIGVDNDTA